MYITESEYRLPYACGMCIDLLDSVEWALAHTSWEYRYLIDNDDTIICHDEEVELVVDPIQEYKSESNNPKEWHSSPE